MGHPVGVHLAVAAALALGMIAPRVAASRPPADGVRMTITGPAVPYSSVTYEVVSRHGTRMAVVRKAFPEPFGQQQGLALLAEDDFQQALGEIMRLAVTVKASTGAATPAVTYRIEGQHDGETVTLQFSDPLSSPHPGPRRLIMLIRDMVESRAGTLAYRDELILPRESGRLRIKSIPPAKVIIDDHAVLGTTPLDPIRVPVGTHNLRLEALEGGAVGEYSVQVEPGRTTALEVEIK
ncbi:MAG: PEGA domain-containing protein [Bradymonadia bacterium]